MRHPFLSVSRLNIYVRSELLLVGKFVSWSSGIAECRESPRFQFLSPGRETLVMIYRISVFHPLSLRLVTGPM